jgi:RAB6A-GEF complex partner protein 1
VHLLSLPSREGAEPSSQLLAPPISTFGSRTTGAVTVMEWSSDGYVLAVGWEHGWAVWSVAGRCLASSFDLEDHSLDETKFQDAFMYGVQQLVGIVMLSC